MPELTNSQRILHKATYVPTKPPAKDNSTPTPARVMEKISFLRMLRIKPVEFPLLERNVTVQSLVVSSDNTKSEKDVSCPAWSMPLLDLVRPLVADNSPATTQRYGPMLANATPDQLATFGRALVDVRRTVTPYVEDRIPVGGADPAGVVTANFPAFAYNAQYTQTLVNGFVDRFTIEPVGRLHLERMEMTPVGIEHGELVHSVPLTPKETVNISHREWSVTTQTFENLVQDSFEGFSETGVAEKTDLTQATSTESKHSSALDVNGSVSASYNGGAYSVTASAAVDYSTHNDDTKSEKDSRAHSVAMTRAASARTKKDHKTSFRVSSVAGTQDLAVRTLTNPSDTNAMRVDYYQLMRKWRVDLIRYGLRMTYDIVVPNPGIDLAHQLEDLSALDAQIERPFEFPVEVNAIQRPNWKDLATFYGADVEQPPEESLTIPVSQELPYLAEDDPNVRFTHYESVEFEVPADYVIQATETSLTANYGHWDGGNVVFYVVDDSKGILGNSGSKNIYSSKLGQFDGLSGKLAIVCARQYVSTVSLKATIKAILKDSAFERWQLKTWSTMHQAAQEAHTKAQETLKDRRAKLVAEIGQFDALTLRRMEREEIMKSVLSWLLGPTFNEIPEAIRVLAVPDPGSTQSKLPEDTYDEWRSVMQYGEFIKYIHNAIEWENVIFFAYPYFWDASQNWPFKRFLVHPDPEHRAFLRAGCARVVLTIRPGFEESFAQLMETGAFNQLPQDHPYVSIGDEIRNFAMTNYEGIPPANPDQNVRTLLYPQQRKAWREMQDIITVLEAHNLDQQQQYQNNHGNDQDYDPNKKFYPPTGGLGELKLPLLDKDGKAIVAALKLDDPWGRPYVYISPGVNNEDYDLACYGKDGVPGGSDLDADITSWAEGSVVGRWCEYTPTSALDVVISTIPPATESPLSTTATPA